MKRLLTVLILTGLAYVGQAQTIQSIPVDSITNIIGQIDESKLLYADSEIELRLGVVYVQKTHEAGAVTAVEKWGLFKQKNLGIGAEVINSDASGTTATLAYFGYRKPLGNVAASFAIGGGYDELENKPLGFAKFQVEHRHTNHIGEWVSFGYAFEDSKIKRGLIAGAGASYSF